MRKLWSVPALLALACLVAGSASAQSNALTGPIWSATALQGKAPVTGTSLTAEFTSAGRVSGSAGCNSYGGSFTQSGSAIKISSLSSTRMACAAKIMAQESKFLDALTAARSYAISGGKLTLKASGGGVLLTFKVQSQQLAGTSWRVTSYNNGKQGVESVLAATKLTAVFAKDGKLGGFAGCNDYNATYKAGAPKLSITKVSSTRKYCAEPAGVMDQESRYLAALATAATSRIEGSTLELRTASGAIAAEFRRA